MSLRTAEPAFRRLIDAIAAHEQLPRWGYGAEEYSPAELLEGLILTESSGTPAARRYEPHQDRDGRRDQAMDPDRPGQDDGSVEDDSSYGLLQVMGYTAKGILEVDRAVRLNFSFLFRPLMGLAFGLEVLKRELRVVYQLHPHETDSERIVRALARYNGGPTGDSIDETGDIRRREYVDKVAANALRAKRARIASGWRTSL